MDPIKYRQNVRGAATRGRVAAPRPLSAFARLAQRFAREQVHGEECFGEGRARIEGVEKAADALPALFDGPHKELLDVLGAARRRAELLPADDFIRSDLLRGKARLVRAEWKCFR